MKSKRSNFKKVSGIDLGTQKISSAPFPLLNMPQACILLSLCNMVLPWHDKLYCLSLLANCSFFFTQLKCILPSVVSLVFFFGFFGENESLSLLQHLLLSPCLIILYCNYLFINLLPHQTLWSSSMAGATSYFHSLYRSSVPQ